MNQTIDDLFFADYDESLGLTGRFDNYDPESVSLSGFAMPKDESLSGYIEDLETFGTEVARGAVGAMMPGEFERFGKAIIGAVLPDADESRVEAFIKGIEEDPEAYSAEDFYEWTGQPQGDLPEDVRMAGQLMGELLSPTGLLASALKKAASVVPKVAKPAAMAAGIAGSAMAPATEGAAQPKGIYNNPGNVEATEGWAGDTGERYGENGRFAVFDSPEMGLRALMRDVRTKLKDKDIKGSIRKMITKYAPPNENPTEEYIAYVEKAVGKKRAALKDAPAITKAILEFENKPNIREYYLSDPKIFETASKLSTKSFSAGTTFEQAKAKMGIK